MSTPVSQTWWVPLSTGKIGHKFAPGDKNTLKFYPHWEITLSSHPHLEKTVKFWSLSLTLSLFALPHAPNLTKLFHFSSHSSSLSHKHTTASRILKFSLPYTLTFTLAFSLPLSANPILIGLIFARLILARNFLKIF